MVRKTIEDNYELQRKLRANLKKNLKYRDVVRWAKKMGKSTREKYGLPSRYSMNALEETYFSIGISDRKRYISVLNSMSKEDMDKYEITDKLKTFKDKAGRQRHFTQLSTRDLQKLLLHNQAIFKSKKHATLVFDDLVFAEQPYHLIQMQRAFRPFFDNRIYYPTLKDAEIAYRRQINHDLTTHGYFERNPNTIFAYFLFDYEGVEPILFKLRDFYQKIRFTDNCRFKLQIQIGFVINETEYVFNRETQEYDEQNQYRPYYPSSNTSVFDEPKFIRSRADIENIISEITKVEDLIDATIDKKRMSSEYKEVKLMEIAFKSTLINEIPLGDAECIEVPDKILNDSNIVSFSKVKNNLCFFYCLGFFLERFTRVDRGFMKVKELFGEHMLDFDNFEGLHIDQIAEFEDFYEVNINVWAKELLP